MRERAEKNGRENERDRGYKDTLKERGLYICRKKERENREKGKYDERDRGRRSLDVYTGVQTLGHRDLKFFLLGNMAEA